MRKYAQYREMAARRRIEFALNQSEFIQLWQKPCSYCGTPIKTIGIDRVDNSIGYRPANCVPSCTRCSSMKLDMDLAEWIAHMYRVLTHLSQSTD